MRGAVEPDLAAKVDGYHFADQEAEEPSGKSSVLFSAACFVGVFFFSSEAVRQLPLLP